MQRDGLRAGFQRVRHFEFHVLINLFHLIQLGLGRAVGVYEAVAGIGAVDVVEIIPVLGTIRAFQFQALVYPSPK